MANKEYQMLFKLSAQAGREFGTTFASAQQQMNQLQKEINQLNQTQADISAYQKQQTAVDNTKRKLEDLQKQFDNIQREYQETGESSSDLANKMIDKQRAIDQTNQKLERETQKLDEMEAELKEAGIDTGNLTEEQRRLAAEMDQAADGMEEAAKEADEFGGKGAAGFEAVGAALAAAGVAEGLKEIGEAYKECVDLSMEFQSTMSTVEALSGATAEEMAELNASAKELGATTKFTASEAGEAMTYMGMAGWNAEQMLAGMPGVLNLAAAAGEDLATVSDIVTDNLTAFGMSASETARFSDVLAAAATGSNTSVSIMGETFKKAAPVAGALGYSIEDVAVATGLMANAGVKGSRAGTALSNTFTGLLEGVTLTGRAIGEVEFSALNADGTMKSFRETVEALRGQFDQLSEAEKTQNAMAIAGKQGYAGLLAVLNATDDDYNKLTDSINNCSGAAEKMAQIKMDNLAGQMTLLNSATEALKNTFGEAYQKELQWLAKIATEVTTGINDFLTKHPAVLKAIIAVTAEVAAFVAAYTAYQVVQKAVLAAQLLLNKAMLLNPWTIALAGVAALTVGLIALVEVQDKEAREVRELSESSREDYERLQEKNAEYERAAELYGENSEEAQYLKWQVEELTDTYEANKQSLEEYMAVHDDIIGGIHDDIDAYRQRERELEGNGTQTLALVHRLQELSAQTALTAGDEEEMRAIIARLNEEFPELGLKIGDVTNGLAKLGNVEAWAKQKADAELYQERQEALVQSIKDEQAARDALETDLAGQESAYERLQEAQARYMAVWGNSEGLGAAFAIFSEEGKELRAAQEAYDAYSDAVAEDNGAIEQSVALHDELVGQLGEYADATMGATDEERALNAVLTDTQEQLAALTASYTEAYDAAYKSISGQYSLWDEAGEVEAVTVDTINAALESQAQHWADYQANLDALNAKTGDIEGLSDVIASFADGSDESVAAIAGMASASEEDLREMVANYQQVQSAQKDVSDSLADLTTEFTNKMDQLQKDLEEDVAAMDLSKESAAAGKATIDAFANEAENSYQRIYDVYAAVRQAAVNALNGGGTVTAPTGGSAYAGGTDSATPGIHLVGEEGPELVLFEGGERVIPADETANMLRSARTLEEAPTGSAGDGGFNVALTINVSGGDAADGVRSAGETLRAQLESMLEDYFAERERRAYR